MNSWTPAQFLETGSEQSCQTEVIEGHLLKMFSTGLPSFSPSSAAYNFFTKCGGACMDSYDNEVKVVY
jgi:hypothetical protein